MKSFERVGDPIGQNIISIVTVLVLIKLTKFAVALRLRCGCVAVPVN